VSDAAALDAEPGSGPGPLLRRAREARGLTGQQVAEQLNLDATLVDALERDDMAALGAPVFAKGHLRRYGAMLGIAQDELLAAYERARGQADVPTLIPRARQEMLPVRGRPKWPWVVGGALLFVLAALLAAYVSENGLEWPSTASDQPAPAVEPATSEPAALQPGPGSGPASDAAAAEAAPSGASTAAPAPMPVPPGHVSVSLAFAADSWAEVYDGSGKAVLYDLGRVGTQRTIAAAAPLSVTLGNAPAVTLSINGRPATVSVAPGGGTVARFTIEADGSVR
jgi:cytoskeleton protein RodZ